MGLLEAKCSSVFNELPPESRGSDISLLFPEARRRRRKRLLWFGTVLAVVIALGLTVLVVGGTGRIFGGPPAISSIRGPSGVPAAHQPAPSRPGPSATHPAICSKAIVPLASRDTGASASLLPCYEAPSLRGLTTQPHAP
jgi:hypothetical protein